jgi:hypothetical protein
MDGGGCEPHADARRRCPNRSTGGTVAAHDVAVAPSVKFLAAARTCLIGHATVHRRVGTATSPAMLIRLSNALSGTGSRKPLVEYKRLEGIL